MQALARSSLSSIAAVDVREGSSTMTQRTLWVSHSRCLLIRASVLWVLPVRMCKYTRVLLE